MDVTTGTATTVGVAGVEPERLSFATDGMVVVADRMGVGHLVDPNSGNPAGRLLFPPETSPSGYWSRHQLAAGSQPDGTVKVWDNTTGEQVGSVSFPLSPPETSTGGLGQSTWVEILPDGSTMLTFSPDGALTEWSLDPATWVQTACATAGRDLTPQEWRQHVGTQPPDDLSCTRP